MEHKMTEILIRIAHLSEKMKDFSAELDKLYDALGDNYIFDMIKNSKFKE